MYYNTTSKISYKAAPTTSNNSGLAPDASRMPMASLSESCIQKITALEETIRQETGKKVALIAYRL